MKFNRSVWTKTQFDTSFSREGFPAGSDSKEFACIAKDLGSISGSGRFPWRRKWQPTPVFLPGEFHGQRSLVGYSPRVRKELDMTEQLHFPLLYCKSCLLWGISENTFHFPWNLLKGWHRRKPVGLLQWCLLVTWSQWIGGCPWVLTFQKETLSRSAQDSWVMASRLSIDQEKSIYCSYLIFKFHFLQEALLPDPPRRQTFTNLVARPGCYSCSILYELGDLEQAK